MSRYNCTTESPESFKLKSTEVYVENKNGMLDDLSIVHGTGLNDVLDLIISKIKTIETPIFSWSYTNTHSSAQVVSYTTERDTVVSITVNANQTVVIIGKSLDTIPNTPHTLIFQGYA